MKPTKNQFFKRQITLSEIGKKGQEKLQNTSVLIVGCGGLGSLVAVYLASSGIGKIHLVDFDEIDVSNLHRQVFYKIKDVGKLKSKVLAKFIKKRAPFTKVEFSSNPITKDNAFSMVKNFDVIVDATDSLPTKYLLNDACVIKNKPLIYGSLYKFDGYVAAFNILQKDNTYSANLRDAFPKMATDIPNCEAAGTLNAIVGFIATAQVNEVLKLVTATGKLSVNQLLIYNALENSQLKMKLTSKVSKEEINKLFIKDTYFDVSCLAQNKDLQISKLKLKEYLSSSQTSKSLQIIAVLPNLVLPFPVDKTIEIQKFDAEKLDVDYSKTYIMICQRGLNSYKAALQMKEKYPTLKVFSLTGGISNFT